MPLDAARRSRAITVFLAVAFGLGWLVQSQVAGSIASGRAATGQPLLVGAGAPLDLTGAAMRGLVAGGKLPPGISPAVAAALQAAFSLTLGTLLGTLFAFGQELAWRGNLLPRLVEELGPWRGGVLLAWLTFASGSLLPAALAHGVLIAAGEAPLLVLPGADPLRAGVLWSPVGLALLAATLVAMVAGGGLRRGLARGPASLQRDAPSAAST